MVVAEGLLERVQLAPPSASPSTVSIAAPSAWTASSMQLFTSVAVEDDAAGAAVAGVAADVGPRQVEVVADEVDEQAA